MDLKGFWKGVFLLAAVLGVAVFALNRRIAHGENPDAGPNALSPVPTEAFVTPEPLPETVEVMWSRQMLAYGDPLAAAPVLGPLCKRNDERAPVLCKTLQKRLDSWFWALALQGDVEGVERGLERVRQVLPSVEWDPLFFGSWLEAQKGRPEEARALLLQSEKYLSKETILGLVELSLSLGDAKTARHHWDRLSEGDRPSGLEKRLLAEENLPPLFAIVEPPFVVQVPLDFPTQQVEALRRTLKAFARSMEPLLGEVGGGRLRLRLLPEKEAREVLPPWAEAFFDGQATLTLPQGSGRAAEWGLLWRLVRHEAAHAWSWAACQGRLPRWVGEGLAQVAEGVTEEEARQGLVHTRGPPTDALWGDLPWKEAEGGGAEAQSAALAARVLLGRLALDNPESPWWKTLNQTCHGLGFAAAVGLEFDGQTPEVLWKNAWDVADR